MSLIPEYKKSKKKIDLSMLGMISSKRVGSLAITVMSELQRYTPEDTALGLAMALLMTCKKHGIHPGDAMSVVTNIMSRAADRTPESEALRAYIQDLR